MIFVTVGTWRFDPLIEVVDRAVGAGRITRPVVAQIANGLYVPQHCEYFRSAPSLASYYERASLVVAHGGTGTTLEVLERRLRLISVANPAVQDNHQDEFLDALESAGYVSYCRDLERLPELIEGAFTGRSLRLMSSTLWAGVSRGLEVAPTPRRARPRLLNRWWSWWLGGCRAAEGVVEVVCKSRVAPTSDPCAGQPRPAASTGSERESS